MSTRPNRSSASETIDVPPVPVSRGVLDVLPADQFDALIRMGRARGGLTQDDVMTVLRSVALSAELISDVVDRIRRAGIEFTYDTGETTVVPMTGAVAAATSRVKVGTWVLSALHRNPAITAKAVETLDEISGGRFVFGLGSGHAGKQAHAFGLPEDHVIGRFEEALEIIAPLLRAGRADFEGTYHAARDLEQRPVGPRPGRIPIMIGAGGPKMLGLAARHADIWSWYVQENSDLAEFAPRLAELEAACLEVGRDPASIGRSAAIIVEPTDVTGAAEALAIPLRGSAEEIADGLRTFRAGGFTQIEILLWPRTQAALEAMAPVLELLDAD